MAKKAQSKTEAMDELFRRSLSAGQALRGEKHANTISLLHDLKTSAYYKHLKDPGDFRLSAFRILARRYFTDRQLCEICGVPYHGSTPEDRRLS